MLNGVAHLAPCCKESARVERCCRSAVFFEVGQWAKAPPFGPHWDIMLELKKKSKEDSKASLKGALTQDRKEKGEVVLPRKHGTTTRQEEDAKGIV